MVAGWFSSSPRQELENGISGRFIPSKANRTEVFRMVRCFSMLQEIFMEPRITVGPTVLALFTSCHRGQLANGRRMYSIASKAERTAIAPSAILSLTWLAFYMEIRARLALVAVPSMT